MEQERDTYKYCLKVGSKTVHYGITYDLERREAEHQIEYPNSIIKQVGRRTTREKAVEWEYRMRSKMRKHVKNSGR